MAADERAHVRDLFDATADTYDNVGVEFFGPIAAYLVGAVAPRPGERALDVGCGRGAVVFPLAEAVGPEGKVVAIDLSPRMVAATAADVAAAGLDSYVRVEVGDAQNPEVRDQSVDLVTSSLVLFFLPDPLEALRAWRLRLKHGGRIGVSTFGEMSAAWHDVDAVFAPYLPKDMADPRLQHAHSPFGSDHGMEKLFGEAELHDLRTFNAVVPVRFDDADQWHRWTWSQGQRRMWGAVPEDERDAVRATAYERLEATRDAEGRIGFDQTVRFTIGFRD